MQSLIVSRILLDNPISCDCDIKWLYEFLVDNKISGPVCTSPPQLSGSNLLDLTFRDFCGMYTSHTSNHCILLINASRILIAVFKIYLTSVNCTEDCCKVSFIGSIFYCSFVRDWFSLFADLPRVNVFLDTTSTVLVKGTPVLLSCNATGHPVPVVSWTKDNNWYVCVACVCGSWHIIHAFYVILLL